MGYLNSLTLSINSWYFFIVDVDKNNFQIKGTEGHGLARHIKESIFIRLNNPTLNRNIGKFNLPHILDRVLFNTPGFTLKMHVQAVGHANSNTSYLTQPNLPTYLGQPTSPTQFLQVLSMLIEPLRTHIRCSFFSSPSDLMKSTLVDESLLSTTNVLFQRRIYLLLNATTDCEIYTKYL